MIKFKSYIIILILFSVIPNATLAQTQSFLSPEEALWLEQRNNTIVVYPEQNNPPYSYQSPSGNIQGLSIDYMELIAEKVGAKIQYLVPRSRSQILSDVRAGKGDVIVGLTPDKLREEFLIFTESYITVPAVIVVRKDFERRTGLTLNDFNGKRVAMVDGSAIENYVNINYPRVVREGVTDDEVGLQQVVLGEVDAAVMDVASLSFYLSKQVLSSVKIAGNTGLDYKPAFALLKDKTILQSILDKGLTQISSSDRNLLVDKWVALPGEAPERNNSLAYILQNNLNLATLYLLFAIGILAIMTLVVTKRSHREEYFRKVHEAKDLRAEFSELEGQSDALTRELEEIKAEEEKLKEKIKSLNQGSV